MGNMLIGIIDADLIGRRRHRFPNLACEKISGYWKEKGAEVHLLLDYSWSDDYDHVYISKVFTDTPYPLWLIESERVHLGGTGFFFDKAPNLPDEIEHHMPDYHLYDEWIAKEVEKARKEKGSSFKQDAFMNQFKEYTDYSIGFLTRGCFRKCGFCVNKKYNRVFSHSPLTEFYDASRKKVCLLDDNFLGYAKWQNELVDLLALGKPFKFKQGLDERLLTDEMCEMLFSSNYDGDFTFAFDNIADYDKIHTKLRMIRKYNSSALIKFYILVGFDGTDETDIENAFKRIELLMKFHCLPYIMRYQNENYAPWKESEYAGLYIALARWCNQPSFFKKISFRQYCDANQARVKTEGFACSAKRAQTYFEEKNPSIAAKYFDLLYSDYDFRDYLTD